MLPSSSIFSSTPISSPELKLRLSALVIIGSSLTDAGGRTSFPLLQAASSKTVAARIAVFFIYSYFKIHIRKIFRP